MENKAILWQKKQNDFVKKRRAQYTIDTSTKIVQVVHINTVDVP